MKDMQEEWGRGKAMERGRYQGEGKRLTIIGRKRRGELKLFYISTSVVQYYISALLFNKISFLFR